ncbi:MAG: sulfatase-like hydrolase/transferase [Clostridia bacterium]|nr:sulfatase-like hydrolase/transferase [Clostridia bacterium]
MKNVILFFTDQQRFDTIGSLGNPVIKTPALDRLLSVGTWFSNAYTPSPVCVSARLSMLTGKYCHQTKCTKNEIMPGGLTSIMHVLKEHGYQTHGAGKMHFMFKDDDLFGFDHLDSSEEIDNGKKDDYKDFLLTNGYGHVKDPHGVRSEMYYIPQPSQLPDRLHHSTWVADRSIDFLTSRNTEKPFFLMSSFIKPHPPFEAPVPFNKLYRAYDMPLPIMNDDDETRQTYWNKIQNRYKGRDKGTDQNLLKTMKAYYYACISHVDCQIGKIMDYLELNDLMDDTMIIFASDHGEMLGDYHCFGKRCFYDGAVRIPLIVKAANQKESACSHANCSLVDLFPTILDELDIPDAFQLAGNSLYNLSDDRAVISQFNTGEFGTYMIKQGNRKYIYSAPDDKEWFFDSAAEKGESVNLALNPDCESNMNDLKRILIDKFEKDGYFQVLDHGDFRKYGKKIPFQSPDEGYLFQDGPGSVPDLKGYTR